MLAGPPVVGQIVVVVITISIVTEHSKVMLPSDLVLPWMLPKATAFYDLCLVGEDQVALLDQPFEAACGEKDAVALRRRSHVGHVPVASCKTMSVRHKGLAES